MVPTDRSDHGIVPFVVGSPASYSARLRQSVRSNKRASLLAGCGSRMLLTLVVCCGGPLLLAPSAQDGLPRNGPGPVRTGAIRNGGLAYLSMGDEPFVWVSVDTETSAELYRLSANPNEAGIRMLIDLGRLMVVKQNTAVRIVDAGFMSHTVRIMEGDHAGREGILAVEFVHATRQ